MCGRARSYLAEGAFVRPLSRFHSPRCGGMRARLPYWCGPSPGPFVRRETSLWIRLPQRFSPEVCILSQGVHQGALVFIFGLMVSSRSRLTLFVGERMIHAMLQQEGTISTSSRSRTLVLALCALCLAVGFGIGYQRGVAGMRGGADKERPSSITSTNASTTHGTVTGIGSKPPRGLVRDVDFKLFWEVWNDLKEQYYEQPVDETRLFYGALHGMAAALGDPYTNYFEPEEADEFADALKGEFSGIGAEIGTKNGQLQIIAPLADSPAERAGLRARDIIVKIDNVDAITMPVDQAVAKIRGPKGTRVTLTIARTDQGASASSTMMRDENLKEVEIVRDTIIVKSVEVKEEADRVMRISIRSFNDDVVDLFEHAVDVVRTKNARGVIIDLRNNPGGYLDKAVMLAGAWTTDVVVEQREQGTITEKYKGEGRQRLRGLPTVVLMNEGSASASEILAGALQDYELATIVGQRSFGKGSVQDYRGYKDGSAVKITIAEWLTPNGRSINKEGIIPDVEVIMTPEDYNADRDPQLEKAIELIRTGQAKPAASGTKR
jgi:carboxyl-terminal processing protease